MVNSYKDETDIKNCTETWRQHQPLLHPIVLFSRNTEKYSFNITIVQYSECVRYRSVLSHTHAHIHTHTHTYIHTHAHHHYPTVSEVLNNKSPRGNVTLSLQILGCAITNSIEENYKQIRDKGWEWGRVIEEWESERLCSLQILIYKEMCYFLWINNFHPYICKQANDKQECWGVGGRVGGVGE